MNPLEGILLVDKPAGPTSHDIVADVRRFTRGRRVGHTGTLDPAATGLLILCIGRATRLSRFLTQSRKVYRGVIHLGIATDTYDAMGRILAQRSVSGLSEATVREAAARFMGTFLQTPPPYSARKLKGRPMYRLARQGKPVAPDPTPVVIFRLDLLEFVLPLVQFEAETSAGTYMRALAHDLGIVLGCGAHLEGLRRLASGRHRVEDAHSMSEILELAGRGEVESLLIPLRCVDLGLPTVTATGQGVDAMLRGRPLGFADLQAPLPEGGPGTFRVQDEAGNLLGVACTDQDSMGGAILRPEVVLAGW